MASKLMKKMVRSESTKPSWKTGMARAPMAKEETTMLAESHCQCQIRQCPISQVLGVENVPWCRLSSGSSLSAHSRAHARYLSARRRSVKRSAGFSHRGYRLGRRPRLKRRGPRRRMWGARPFLYRCRWGSVMTHSTRS